MIYPTLQFRSVQNSILVQRRFASHFHQFSCLYCVSKVEIMGLASVSYTSTSYMFGAVFIILGINSF